jgi:hypothetical protein
MLSHFFRNSSVSGVPDAAGAAIETPHAASLSITALERLVPSGHLKGGYPHIWERIWLFCNDPAHLEKYLVSLSIQNRGGKRKGLCPEAMNEIADILAANQRFLPPPAAGEVWDAASQKR